VPSSRVVHAKRFSPFVTPFWQPGEKPAGVLCCQFFEVKFSNGCMFHCDFCYLRNTFKYRNWRGGEQTLFSNTDDLKCEIREYMKFDKPYVFHTGEVADSLAAPGSEQIITWLVKQFGMQKRHTLLLLTKSNNVEFLMPLPHNSRTVCGFSVNPPEIAQRFEVGAATTEERLAAAEMVMETGYPVMVRVDPMIPIDGWERQYMELFERLNTMPLHGVVVGTLRAFPNLRNLMRPALRKLLTVRDIDGRWHIPNETRTAMYNLAFGTLKFKRMGLCKESGSRWGELIRKFGPHEFICNCHLPLS
jgi:spore photoproduct lyase